MNEQPPSPAASLPSGAARIGPYRVIREIGRGGMGSVLLAVRDDDAFQKRVALKVLKRGMDTEAIVRRFRTERQILAGLQHPYIAGLLDGGTTADGLPYFAMEYVEGRTILDYCDAHRLDTAARLQLFRKVCEAVHHAHRNLVVHRDIKPGNVLVGADGTPKLLDFGIAKLLTPEAHGHTIVPTAPGLELMTPEYASPEQVRGEPVTTASDVYSLGVLLYELLTGRRPYRLTGRTPSEIARVVCESVPERPSTAVARTARAPLTDDDAATRDAGDLPTRPPAAVYVVDPDSERLRRRLSGDLDTIVLKALSKDPSRRYASADQFAEDVQRHLAGLPVMARPDTLTYRAAKFVRRNRAAVAAAALVLLSLVAGIVGTVWQAREARRERAIAERRFDDVRALANAALFDLHDAIRDLPGSTPARQLLVSNALTYLDRLSRDAGDRQDLKRELAAAYVKVGDVQGRPYTPNLGDAAGALASYRKATAIYEDLAAGASPEPDLRREMALALLRLSDVLASTAGTAEALAHAERARALLVEVHAQAAADADVRRELAVGHSRVGDLRSATGDTQGALLERRRALALMESLAAEQPDDEDNLRQLGVAFQRLGNTLGNPNYPNVGDHAGALQHLERAILTFERAVDLHPANATLRRNLAVVRSNAADVLLALHRQSDAIAQQRQALAIFEALSAADPQNAEARNDIAISLGKIAELLDAAGQPEAAERHLQEALGIHAALSAADPVNARLKLEVASDYNRLGVVQARLNRRASLDAHTQSVTIARELAAGNPGDLELPVALALALIGRADGYAQFARAPGAHPGDLAAARRDYAEAVDLLAGLESRGVLAGTDLDTLAAARGKLAALGAQRAAAGGR